MVAHAASAADVHISLLGGFSAVVAGQPVADHWRLRKAKALVKLLALAPGHRLHRELVVDTLWPDAEPRAAANNLHQLVYNVRRMLGPESIGIVGDVVRLGPAGGVSVDVDLFEEAAARARTHGDVRALREALELWTGPLLPEDLYADWATEHRERLTESHGAVATLLGAKLSEGGDPEAALALVEPLAFARPLDEHLHRVLIAGGKALPALCDIRDEVQVADAVAKTVERFGGIDICVNNASAINLTGTLQTDMKRYDLMHQINTRGTFLVFARVFPHLEEGCEPAYPEPRTAARHEGEMVQEPRRLHYGEVRHVDVHARHERGVRQDGIAVNSLWPLTTIDTAAVRNLLGGETVAAHEPLAGDSRRRGTCNFSAALARDDRQLFHRRGGIARGRRQGLLDLRT